MRCLIRRKVSGQALKGVTSDTTPIPKLDGLPKWPEVLARGKQLLALVRDAAPKEPLEMPTAHIYILGTYWRGIRLYEAVLTLLQAQLPEEAAIVARSAFVDSLRLRELADDPENRDARLLGWANESINEKVGLIKEAMSLGLETEGDSLLSTFEEERSQLQAYAKRHGISKFRTFLPPREAALRFGRKDDYWTYAWSHEAVHGSDAGWMFSRRKVSAGSVGLFGKTSDPEILVGFAAFAAASVVDAAFASALIFGWKLPPIVKDLLNEVQQAAQTCAG